MVLIQPQQHDHTPTRLAGSSATTDSRHPDEAWLLANTFEQVDSLLAGQPISSKAEGDSLADTMVDVPPQAPPNPGDVSSSTASGRSIGFWRSAWILGPAALVGVMGVVIMTQIFAPTSTEGPARTEVAVAETQTTQPSQLAARNERPSAVEDPVPSAHTAAPSPVPKRVMKPIVTELYSTDPGAAQPQENEIQPVPLAVPEAPAGRERIDVDSLLFDEPHHPADVQIVVSGSATGLDARERIGEAIESLELPAATLGDFGRLIEQLADVPLTIEPEALAMTRIDLSQPVSIDVRAHTVGETLAKGLRPLHLGYRLSGSHVIVQHRAILENRPESLKLDVSDLLGPDATESSLASRILDSGVIEELHVGTASSPLTCSEGAIFVQAAPQIQFRVLQFLERLRLAKGQPTRTVYGPALRDEVPYHRRARDILRQDILPQWSRRTTLSQLVDHLHQQTQAYFLIDWPALEGVGIHYHSVLEINGQPGSLHEFLMALAQIRLSFHAVDNHTILLTTIDGESQSGVIVFHPMHDLVAALQASPQQLVASLQSAFAESVARDGLHAPAMDLRFVYDPASEHLITYLPPSLHVRFGRGLERLHQAQRTAGASAQAKSRESSPEHPFGRRQTG